MEVQWKGHKLRLLYVEEGGDCLINISLYQKVDLLSFRLMVQQFPRMPNHLTFRLVSREKLKPFIHVLNLWQDVFKT